MKKYGATTRITNFNVDWMARYDYYKQKIRRRI